MLDVLTVVGSALLVGAVVGEILWRIQVRRTQRVIDAAIRNYERSER